MCSFRVTFHIVGGSCDPSSSTMSAKDHVATEAIGAIRQTEPSSSVISETVSRWMLCRDFIMLIFIRIQHSNWLPGRANRANGTPWKQGGPPASLGPFDDPDPGANRSASRKNPCLSAPTGFSVARLSLQRRPPKRVPHGRMALPVLCKGL